MIVELGHFALILGFAVALFQATVPLWGAIRGDAVLARLGAQAALVHFALLALAFAALTHAYLVSDFSVLNVFQNSHSLKPLIYKWSGVWGNHEGSMLLWVLILALFGAGVAVFSKRLPDDMLGATLGVQGLIASAFCAFLIFASNPFLRMPNPPIEGRDLNPVLQDPGLAIHPPLLYLGYVGFSIVFSFAAAALVLGRVDAAFARMIRPWTLAAWITLTLGIAMGSYWAYYELGWGGYWFWDPVENASLMPWLTGTALLHSAIVLEKREALKTWTILLAVVTFSLSLLGTFLVRSGVLTSVHAFAVDPERGLFILLILIAFIGGSFALFAARASALQGGGLFAPISREGALVFNNLFLSVASLAVFVGTLYPLLLEALTGAKISVGPPFFNLTAVPLMVPLFLAIPFGQKLAWKRGDLLGASQRLWICMALGVVGAAISAYAAGGGPVLALAGIGLGIFLVLGALDDLLDRGLRGGIGMIGARLRAIPQSITAMALAHAGAGLMVIGISATAFETEKIAAMKPGETLALDGYTLRLEGIGPVTGPNYNAIAAEFSLRDPAGTELARLRPAKRVYIGRQMPTSEVGRYRHGLSEIYLAIGETSDGQHVDLRAYHKPFVLLIWLGPLLMSIGGILSLLDRRLRIGVPARRARLRPEPAE
ncbi:heme lyase CcmF/NrfE family subunit [Rhabdaerophilum sp. SD176]|uniref:heme lyase CcmF/NrfE family subunit n=1 Tax=Rhabdaerophilum sp. SD176 TaxID=2983548 RepID=UPI0024DF53B9|nr:heme lyase CcmF/NrfE family subunit [Rhabdaerophilum sp. SD176]